MSKMSTTAVIKCKYCGKNMIVRHMVTANEDPTGEQLGQFMKGLSKTAMCKECQKKYNYYASQGRSDEFIRGMLSPIQLP